MMIWRCLKFAAERLTWLVGLMWFRWFGAGRTSTPSWTWNKPATVTVDQIFRQKPLLGWLLVEL